MGFLLEKCTLFPLNNEILSQCQSFSCGDSDLDDFFLNDVENFDIQLLGKSFCYRLDENPSVIVCAFTLANSSIDGRNLPNNRKKKLTEHIPYEKHLSSYPAMLIGRLGVNKDYGNRGIGSELIRFIRTIALAGDWSACRYLTVDAYNNEITRKYYEINGFLYLFSSEKQEKEYIGMREGMELKTRLMYFDLIQLSKG
ncbi:MAG: GNAT family N-acetyltransferase [Tannerellaceae bacterium]|jgi:GNAT superfamily N-acetyltransferase|nr:GNAT family N-acetyltransferase [Tannerellaceae bacterium]